MSYPLEFYIVPEPHQDDLLLLSSTGIDSDTDGNVRLTRTCDRLDESNAYYISYKFCNVNAQGHRIGEETIEGEIVNAVTKVMLPNSEEPDSLTFVTCTIIPNSHCQTHDIFDSTPEEHIKENALWLSVDVIDEDTIQINHINHKPSAQSTGREESLSLTEGTLLTNTPYKWQDNKAADLIITMARKAAELEQQNSLAR